MTGNIKIPFRAARLKSTDPAIIWKPFSGDCPAVREVETSAEEIPLVSDTQHAGIDCVCDLKQEC